MNDLCCSIVQPQRDCGVVRAAAVDLQPIVLAHEPDFRIGDVQVRPAARELIVGDHHACLEPRVMQVLIGLHRAGGAVVTKDELIERCWNGRIVGEDAISRVMSRLRTAASHDARGQFRIETITKVGYRLVEVAATAGPPPANENHEDGSTPARRSRRAVLVGAGAAFLTGGGVLGLDLVRRERLEGEARELADEASRALLLGSPDADASAVGMLQRAATLEPDSPTVQGRLALSYMKMIRTADPEQRTALRERGLSSARRALELEAGQPDAEAALLTATPLFRNWLAFERVSTPAYQRHPDHLELCILRATLLAAVGRIGEILEPCVKAVKRAPVHPDVQCYYALTLLQLGRLEQGEMQLERCFGLWPRRLSIFTLRFDHLVYNHRADEALRMIRDRARRPGVLWPIYVELAEARAVAVADGRPEQVKATLDRFEKSAQENVWLAQDAIMFAANRGDLDRAFRILDALYFGRGFRVPGEERDRMTFFLFWRVMAPVRRDPRFAQLIRALGLDTYWQQSGSQHLVTA